MESSFFINDLRLNSPKGFGHELFYLFCLVNTKAEGRGLARTVREHPVACALHWARKCAGLVPRKCNTDLEVQDLSGIDRNTLVIVGFVLEALEGSNNILVGNG